MIHGTDKVEGVLMVLFFGLVFFVGPLGNFTADALVWTGWCHSFKYTHKYK